MSLKTLSPVLITLIGGILAAFTPSITAWVSAHPDVATLLAGVGGTLLHALESPVTPKS